MSCTEIIEDIRKIQLCNSSGLTHEELTTCAQKRTCVHIENLKPSRSLRPWKTQSSGHTPSTKNVLNTFSGRPKR